MVDLSAYQADDLVSVPELAQALEMGESTVWLFAKRQKLQRYRTPARGKTTLFRWQDVVDAYLRPVALEPRGTRE